MNTRTNWIHIGAGLLWMAGLWLCLRQPAPPSPTQQTPTDTLSRAANYLFDSPSGPTLLLRGGERLTRLQVNDTALVLNKASLPFRRDTANTRDLRTARDLTLWRDYFSLLLGNTGSTDAERWTLARQKLAAFCAADGSPKVGYAPVSDQTDQALFQRFIAFVDARQKASETTLILDNDLTLERLTLRTLADNQTIQPVVAEASPLPKPAPERNQLGVWLLALGGLLWGGLVLLTRNRPTPSIQPPGLEGTASAPVKPEPAGQPAPARPPVVVQQPSTPKAESAPTDPSSTQALLADRAALDQYIAAFYERYGDFYDRLQTQSTELTDAEQQRVRRELVEMALHAHAFVEGCRHLPLTRLTEVPNVRLLVQPAHRPAVADLTTDPYLTPKRYRLLLPVLRDMDLGELENALLQDLHVPKELL